MANKYTGFILSAAKCTWETFSGDLCNQQHIKILFAVQDRISTGRKLHPPEGWEGLDFLLQLELAKADLRSQLLS